MAFYQRHDDKTAKSGDLQGAIKIFVSYYKK